ncbi:MAG: autotransporter-associated beta strand repeat-containing protein, partial [Verrucomicrobiota bacterium]
TGGTVNLASYALTTGDSTNTSFSGVISGTGGSLVKTGAGTLTLGGNNTFTGGVTLNAGAIQLANTGALNSSTPNNITFGASAAAGTKLQLNGNSVTIGALSTNATPGSPVIENANASAATLTVSQATNTTYAGLIQDGSGGGALSFTKTGSGTLQLHTASGETYTGATAVQNGSLQLGGGAGNILPTTTTVTLGTSGSATAGKLILGDGDIDNDDQTLAGLLVASGNTGTNYVVGGNASRTSALTLNIASTNTYAGVLGGTTATENNLSLTKTGVGTLTLTGANTFTGGTTISSGILSIGGDANIGGTPGSATPGSIVINGGILSVSATFTLNSFRGIAVGPSSGSGTGTLDVATNKSLTYSGILANNGSGIGGLTKTGAGTLILGGANSYTGPTAVSAGTLTLSGGSAIADTSAVTLSNVSGVLLKLNASETIGSLAGGGVTGGNVNLQSYTLTAGSDNSDTIYAGVMSGTGAFAKSGSGTQTLTAVQTYTGTTTITLGTLKLGVANALPFGFGNGNLTVNGTLDLAGYSQTVNALSGSGYVTNSVAGIATLTAGSQNTTSAFSGNIQNGTGTVALTKIGTGVLTLSGTNTYSGATTISTGTLQVGSISGLSANSTITIASVGTLDVNGFNASIDGLLGTGTITNNGSSLVTLTAGSAGGTSSFDGVIQDGSHALALTKSGGGTLTLNGINTYSGATTISNGTLSVANPGAGGNLGSAGGAIVLGDSSNKGTLSYTSNADLSYTRGFTVNAGGGEMDITSSGKTLTLLTGGVATSGTFTLGGAGNGVINSIISGSGGFTKANTGNLVLGSANTYSGDTTISSGVLQLGNAAALPSGTGKGNLVLNATLDVNNLSITISGLSGAGVLTNSGGSPITLTAGDNNAAGNYTGVLQDGGGIMSLVKIGSGLLTLGGVNTYSGDTTISGGTLQIGNSFALASGPSKGNVSIGSSGTLDLNNCNLTLNGLSGSGMVTNNLGASVLTVGANDQTFTFGGNLQDGIGTLGLTKTGIGTLTLSGNNTFSGASTLASGILSMASDTALSYRSTLTVNNAGTLDLNGHLITIDGLAGTGSIINNSATRVTLTTGASGGGGIFAGTLNDGTGVIALTKVGSGTVTLSNVNGYSGGTTVTGGLLAITSTGALGAIPGTPTVSNIVLNGGGISATNTFEINANRGITLGSSSGSLDAAQNQTLTYNGILAGSGGLTKTGLGTLTLGGANTYAGDTVLNVGALQIAAANAIPSGSGKGNLSLDVGTTLDLNNTSITVNGLSGSGLVSNTKIGSVTFSAGANDRTSSFGGVIENGNGATSFNKVGGGVLTLTGTSTYTGGTTITGGKLSINVSAEIGLETNPLTISTGAALLASDSFNTSRATLLNGAGSGAGGAIEVA